MFTLKHVFVFFILQNTISAFCLACPDSVESTNTIKDYDEYSEESQYSDVSESNVHLISENGSNKVCLEEDHSFISQSDIKYLIEDKADIFKIKENFENSYYPIAEEIFKKYMGELEVFQETLNARPEHMLHILHDMARLRQKLEPDVEQAETLLQQLYSVEDNFNDVIKDSAIKLNQLEKYKNMCKINCEEIGIENRFGHTINKNLSQPAAMYCVRVKDLNDIIINKLSEVQAQYDEELNQQLEIRDKMYAQNMTELKINLKEAAVKQFDMTMYDILSLQDDYSHFVKYLKHLNISSESFNILENTAEISFRVIGLNRDLEKYRYYCMKCNMNQRIKRNVLDWHDDSLDGVVDNLIKARINEIRESIRRNFTSMFEELDKQLNDPDVIDIFVMQLHPIQNEIGNDIKTEQEALRRLSSRIPEASIDKILALSKESKQIIQNLESAKQFIDQFIS